MKKLKTVMTFILLAHLGMAQRAPRLKTVPDINNQSLFTYTIKTSSKSKKDVSVRWVRPQVLGVSNAASSGNTKVISEYLNNTTSLPVKVKYIITMTIADCCEHTDTLQVTVKPSDRLVKDSVSQIKK